MHKLLQEYGQFGEQAIRSYTQQILSGLAYLHAKYTVHGDIKGANILVDSDGRVKLADFGMPEHITGQSCPLSFKGSPCWMAPEVIKNTNGSNLAVDIWSLGCTVIELASAKPPWSKNEGVCSIREAELVPFVLVWPGVMSVHDGSDTTMYFRSCGFAFIHANSFVDIIALEAIPLDQTDRNLGHKRTCKIHPEA